MESVSILSEPDANQDRIRKENHNHDAGFHRKRSHRAKVYSGKNVPRYFADLRALVFARDL